LIRRLVADEFVAAIERGTHLQSGLPRAAAVRTFELTKDHRFWRRARMSNDALCLPRSRARPGTNLVLWRFESPAAIFD
jgi:hypothetical protein